MNTQHVSKGRIEDTVPEPAWRYGNIDQANKASISLGVCLTEACPVGCSHCIVDSVPDGADIDVNLLGRWLRGAGASLPISGLCFTGGEPFYRFALLEEAVCLGRSLGLATGLVTSAFWAIDDQYATDQLERLRFAGLTCIGISMDEEHARKIPPERPRRAIRIAAGLGLKVTLSARFPSRLVSDDISTYIREMVGPELELVTDIVQGDIQPLGRATNTENPAKLGRRRLCPASGLMVTVNGSIKCCCSIALGGESPLVLGCINKMSLETAHSLWRNSVLMLALVAGGVNLLWEWCEEAGLAPSLAGRFAANDVCGACSELLGDATRVTYIRQRASTPATRFSLALRHFLITGDSWALLNANELS